jgi:hypothetical protein
MSPQVCGPEIFQYNVSKTWHDEHALKSRIWSTLIWSRYQLHKWLLHPRGRIQQVYNLSACLDLDGGSHFNSVKRRSEILRHTTLAVFKIKHACATDDGSLPPEPSVQTCFE